MARVGPFGSVKSGPGSVQALSRALPAQRARHYRPNVHVSSRLRRECPLGETGARTPAPSALQPEGVHGRRRISVGVDGDVIHDRQHLVRGGALPDGEEVGCGSARSRASLPGEFRVKLVCACTTYWAPVVYWFPSRQRCSGTRGGIRPSVGGHRATGWKTPVTAMSSAPQSEWATPSRLNPLVAPDRQLGFPARPGRAPRGAGLDRSQPAGRQPARRDTPRSVA